MSYKNFQTCRQVFAGGAHAEWGGFYGKIISKKILEDQGGDTFRENKTSACGNIKHSSYLVSKCFRLVSGLLERLWKIVLWAARKTKMPNCLIFTGTNHCGDSLGGIATANVSLVTPILTKICANCKIYPFKRQLHKMVKHKSMKGFFTEVLTLQLFTIIKVPLQEIYS